MRGCLEVRIESGRFQADKENIILQRALADCKLVNVISIREKKSVNVKILYNKGIFLYYTPQLFTTTPPIPHL